ncbi:MAG TPA: type II toxin-antitoxin system RelE/ParE family toxin [Acidobacteriaceae bacterium]|nr:type II toxin-antitoxin system RelE/ParE family toxin [Acidobacteriaceae bacterium]
MTVRLHWSELALDDREGIFSYIEAENPRAAVEMDLRIRDQTRTLLDFPAAGRPGRVRGTREFVIHESPYIAAYRIEDDRIVILRVLHGARRWPKRL